MTLALGTRLGPYEILAPLGAGGMGEVYRARDPRLGRDVAVKVLPRAVAADPERQQRFEAEARAAGALNHPNIVTLHDVGVEGGVPYLVTEVLEGENLRGLIARGSLTPHKAIQIITQVANGLSAAHAKGIVHRDLKPENLFVLPDGRVKILDFGIAKLVGGGSGSTTATAETTPVFASMTAAGTIMGTVSYMAPEQLRDQAVDHRADLFALGAIFHELLTGTQPFQGDTAADRVSAILMAEPPALPPATESQVPGIGATIARLLAKRPEGRLDSASDLAFMLEVFARRPARPAGAAADADPDAGSAAGASGTAPSVRFRPLTFRDGEIFCALFAPDGQTFVYQATVAGNPSEIFLARVESPDARPVAGLQNADLQSVSSTAELAVTLQPRDIGGFIRLGTLARAPLVGGRPRELAHDVFHADWFPDGKSLAAIRKAGAGFQIEAPLGTVIHKTNGWMSNIRVSHDGKQIAFLDHPVSGNNGGYACVIRPGERYRRLSGNMPTISNVVWGPDGKIWFAAQGEDSPDGVYAVTLDGKVRHVYSAPGYGAVEDFADNGDALYHMLSPRMLMETSTRSGGRAEALDLSWLDWSLARDVSIDGSTVLFDETGIASGGVAGVYLRSIDGEPAVRLSDGVGFAISEDGHFVVGTDLSGPNSFTIIPIGAGEIRRVSTGDLSPRYGGWLPGNREVVVIGVRPEGAHLYRVEIESGAVRRIHDKPVTQSSMVLSPDGTQVLVKGEDGFLTLFPVDGGTPRAFPDLDATWRQARWMGDSKSFFVFRTGRIPAPVFRVDAATGAKEPWTEIEPLERSGISGVNSLLMARDGERYVCSYSKLASSLFHARGLR